MKTEVLRLLKESEGYLSGQDICNRLKVSRTAVWKIIKQLKDEGYQIEAVQNRGYRLVGLADVMTEAELFSRMKSKWAGRYLDYSETVDSTNNRAKQLAERGAKSGTLIIADSQSAGKGRRGRSWTSPPGTGIWMSLILRPQILPSCASMLTLVAAMAVSDGIDKETGLNSQIKWPNDIVVDGRKVCGILTEMSAELDGIHYVVVGMGINANTKEFPEEIAETATSLCRQTGQTVWRSQIIAAVMEAFEGYYDKFMESRDLSLLYDAYNKKLANYGREVMVMSSTGNYQGVSHGINQKGELLVELPDKTVTKVVSGEVSVRGIYGYV